METMVSPLAKKLKLKPGHRAAVAGAPPGYLEQLAPPADVEVSETLDGGPFDWIQVFVRTSAELAAVVEPLTAAISPTGHVWISYPKGKSIPTDLNRDSLYRTVLEAGLQGVSQVAIDDVWSALRFKNV